MPAVNPVAAVPGAASGNVPVGRLGDPQDQANAIVVLASDEASYISGECLFANGLQAQC